MSLELTTARNNALEEAAKVLNISKGDLHLILNVNEVTPLEYRAITIVLKNLMGCIRALKEVKL